MSSLRIGFLPFYVDYYEGICANFPREKAAVAEVCAKELARFGDVGWDKSLVRDLEGAAQAGASLAHWKPDCVVVVTTIAVFGGICRAALTHIDVPILIWNPQLIESVDEGYSMEDIVRNTGQIGTQALANTLVREGRRFRVITGHLGSASMAAELDRFFRVQSVAAALRKARLLAVGGSFELMTDILIDEKELRVLLGPTVAHVSTEELTRRYLAVAEETVACKVAHLRSAHAVIGLTDDELSRSARLSAAFAGLVEDHGADAGSFNCHGGVCLRNPAIGITGCLAHGEQNAHGRPFTCTGDLATAIAMLILKKLTGGSMYTEVQVMDERRAAVVIANSGEGEDAIRRLGHRSTLIANMNFRGCCGRGASFCYPLADGPATLASFTPVRGGFRLIVAEGDVLGETLPDAGALAGFFRFAGTSLTRSYCRWMEAGAVHHAATALGHWASELRELCDWLGIEFVEVDSLWSHGRKRTFTSAS